MNHWPVLAWFMLYLLIAGALQLYTSYPPDFDTAYHVAVGRLMSQYGILHSFPWTPFSWLADNYTDDKILFHLLFVPLANLNWVTAVRIVGTIAGATILLTLYLILRSERVRYAGLWALVPLIGSEYFIIRFVVVRPHLLSISVALVFLWAAVRGRFKILAVVSAIYPWLYIAFWQLAVLLLIAAETARFLAGRKLQWKPAVIVAAGIAIGVLIHPNAENLFAYNWLVMTEVLFKGGWLAREGFDLGKELAPYPLIGWLKGLSISVLLIFAAAIYAWRNRREEVVPLAFTLAALGFCILTIKSARFAEYFVPFSAAAMALSSRWIKWRFLAPAVVAVSLILTVVVGRPTMVYLSKIQEDIPPALASKFRQFIPKGSQVFTTGWETTGTLMLTLPERYFIVALDPTLFYMKDKELYRLWYRLVHEAPPETVTTIRQTFGARYVIVDWARDKSKFNNRLFSTRGVRLLYSTPFWMVFDLGPPAVPKESSGPEKKSG
ncbi:MAG: hypothetical protein OEM01_00685 [Desulfobulbaceae bacterium]|nr:hypothetical protein [Desulfobulbaceae bacterium]